MQQPPPRGGVLPQSVWFMMTVGESRARAGIRLDRSWKGCGRRLAAWLAAEPVDLVPGRASRRGRHDTIEKIRAAGTKALLPGLAEKLVGTQAAVEWAPQATLIIERARPDGVMAGLAAMAARPDRSAVFNSFAGPRLVIHGTEDGLIPVSEAGRTGPSPPDVRLILDGIGHMPMWEAPEATADGVISWANSLRR